MCTLQNHTYKGTKQVHFKQTGEANIWHAHTGAAKTGWKTGKTDIGL